METTFCELKNKEVINTYDGKNLGNIIDIVLDCNCGKILGIIVPDEKKFFDFFKANNGIFIPCNRICKIGKDTILVDIIIHDNNSCNISCAKYQNENINQNNKNNHINVQNILDNIKSQDKQS